MAPKKNRKVTASTAPTSKVTRRKQETFDSASSPKRRKLKHQQAVKTTRRTGSVVVVPTAPLSVNDSVNGSTRTGSIIDNTSHGAGQVSDGFGNQIMALQPAGIMSITAPLGGHISILIKQKIINGEFVELGTLLPGYEKVPSHGFTISQTGVLAPLPPRSRPILSIEQWTDAFLIFTAIFISQHPDRATELLKYTSIIRDAARKFHGSGWRDYDIEFRRRQASNPSQCWAVIDGELWCTILMASGMQRNSGFPLGGSASNGGPHLSSPSLQQGRPRWGGPTANTFTATAGGNNETKGLCYAFNRSQGCPWPFCRWKHTCSRCASTNHGASSCSVAPTRTIHQY